MEKLHQLERVLADCESVCLGYSGGVDSAFLAVVAVDVLGAARVLAVTGRSASYPDVQWQVARDVAAQFGIPQLEIDTAELQDENYLANPANRCYFCKTELWSRLRRVAADHALATIIDGSNADDAHDYRPGAQAAREHGVRSPLAEAGLTKAEIRAHSRARGLPTWDQPSAPCLSSRLPYGIAVTPERLRQVELAEEAVRALGAREFRVRHHGEVARLEIAPSEMRIAIDAAEYLNLRLRELGFRRVLLDAEGYRRGALNEALPLVQLRRPAGAANGAGDIAVLAVAPDSIEEARAAGPALRQQGFRYVAIDLASAASRPRAGEPNVSA